MCDAPRGDAACSHTLYGGWTRLDAYYYRFRLAESQLNKMGSTRVPCLGIIFCGHLFVKAPAICDFRGRRRHQPFLCDTLVRKLQPAEQENL
jgi:hypothetical protein